MYYVPVMVVITSRALKKKINLLKAFKESNQLSRNV